jgi:hypothetical protein
LSEEEIVIVEMENYCKINYFLENRVLLMELKELLQQNFPKSNQNEDWKNYG